VLRVSYQARGSRLGSILSDLRGLFLGAGSRIHQLERIGMANACRCVWCVSGCQGFGKIAGAEDIQKEN